MAQLPPDSHCARRSQSESGAALAAGAMASPAAENAVPARTTLTAFWGAGVAEGARWRPVYEVIFTRQSFSLCAYEVSCRVRTSAPGRRGGFTPSALSGAGPRVGPVRVPRPRPVDGLVPHRPQGGVRCASDADSLTSLYRTVAARSRIVTIPKCFVASQKRYLGRYQVVTLGLW